MSRAYESLVWNLTDSGALPDADTTVLIWIRTVQESNWESGWFDGEHWRLCESGGICAGTVVAWAEVNGPEGHA